MASWAQLTKVLRRGEQARPGVYVLMGLGASGASRVYVGEADVLRERLKQHAKFKDFWTRVVACQISGRVRRASGVTYQIG